MKIFRVTQDYSTRSIIGISAFAEVVLSATMFFESGVGFPCDCGMVEDSHRFSTPKDGRKWMALARNYNCFGCLRDPTCESSHSAWMETTWCFLWILAVYTLSCRNDAFFVWNVAILFFSICWLCSVMMSFASALVEPFPHCQDVPSQWYSFTVLSLVFIVSQRPTCMRWWSPV